MDVSVIWSVYDRRDLVLRALGYLERQSLDRRRWEVVIIDDGSPGNYIKDLEPWKGRLNIQYAKIDQMDHPIIQQLNPGGKPLVPPDNEPLKFHTPALSHNIGFKLARGDVLFITQPDILHAENNLKESLLAKQRKQFMFGKVWMSDKRFREQIMQHDPQQIAQQPYQGLKSIPGSRAFTFKPTEHYWFVSAVSRHAAHLIRGVEERYLGGVFAEDDQFRERIRLAGWAPVNNYNMEGIHIDHSHLSGRHHRSSPRWQWGANRNRSMWRAWMADPNRQAVGNTDWEWGDLKYVQEHVTWGL